jgi:hypothetical protein
VRKQTPRGSQTKLFVQTSEAMAGMVVANDDKPLDPEQRRGEMWRIKRFLKDPDEMKKKQKQEKEDAARIRRILKALPDAFLYERAGVEPNGLVRLNFRPNPKYDPPSRVEQVLTGMEGYVLLDTKKNRIARIEGTLVKDVSFGWGILGHLDRGGHILLEQANVGGDHWEITRMDLSFTGKILIFKSINVQSSEVYSGFRPVPSDLTYAQGVELLAKEESIFSETLRKNRASN